MNEIIVIGNVVKVFAPSAIAFCIGMIITPFVTHFLYKNEMWKKKAGKMTIDGKETPIFNELHKTREVGTPKMGGIVIWASAVITTIGIWLIAEIFPGSLTSKLDFLSRNQTWIPLFTLLSGAFVGLIDDYMDVKGSKDNAAGGLSLKKRLVVVGLIALFCGWWFYAKLGVSSIGLPFTENFQLGWFFIPFFVLVTIFIYSGGVIDGIDGLAGGIFAAMFSSYAGIAYFQNQINLAAFCAVIVGGILAFLWFNIPPARFYMTETGSMALTITLAVVAFMTDSAAHVVGHGGYGVLVLPVVAFPLIATSLSNIIQMFSKKLRGGKKVFRIAPIHHHFEAIGWPAYKVTMRYWVLAIFFALAGIILALIG